MLEELKDLYGTEWTTTLINISTNEQKKEWFLRLDPNGTLNYVARFVFSFISLIAPWT